MIGGPSDTVWQPTPQQVASSQLSRLCRVEGLSFADDAEHPDYPGLYAWSLAEPARFWQGVWRHTGVVGTPDRRAPGAEDIAPDAVYAGAEHMLDARFFPYAELNYAENLLAPKRSGPALIACDETGTRETLGFAELRDQSGALAAQFARLGVRAGDRVAAALPNGVHAVLGMLACARLGAVWSSCSPDFGGNAMHDRFEQIQPTLLLGCRNYLYNGKRFECEAKLDDLQQRLTSTPRLLYLEDLDQLRTTGIEPPAFKQLPFSAPLFILFSSGTTGTPKCIVHSVGGTLLTHRKEHALHANLGGQDRLLFYTTCGWMMWNWLVSALAGGTTVVLYDGAPLHPQHGALLTLCETHSVTHLGISPGYLSALSKAGYDVAAQHPALKLRGLLSTGSPLPDAAYHWVAEQFGEHVQLASISGGTDILGCFALGNPWQPVRVGELQGPALGMALAFFDEDGQPVSGGRGELVCTQAFPSQPVGFWNDDGRRRYRAAYFERFPGVWHHGDFGEFTASGGVRIHGRSDAVLNRGGVRIGTAELYRQLEPLTDVLESVAVAQRVAGGDVRILLFLRLADGAEMSDQLAQRVQRAIREGTSPRHVPDLVLAVPDIPRTRSGKIVELAITRAIHGEPVQNTDALANPEALAHFTDRPELRQV